MFESYLNHLQSEKVKITFYKDFFPIKKGEKGYVSNLIVDKKDDSAKINFCFENNAGSQNFNLDLPFDLKETFFLPFFDSDEKICYYDFYEFAGKNCVVSGLLSINISCLDKLKGSKTLPEEILDYFYENSRSKKVKHNILSYASKCSVLKRKRLSSKLENSILNDYTLSGFYSISHDINLTEKQQEFFLADKIGTYPAKYALDLLKENKKVPNIIHNYLISIKCFGMPIETITKKKLTNNYFVETYFRFLESIKKSQSSL